MRQLQTQEFKPAEEYSTRVENEGHSEAQIVNNRVTKNSQRSDKDNSPRQESNSQPDRPSEQESKKSIGRQSNYDSNHLFDSINQSKQESNYERELINQSENNIGTQNELNTKLEQKSENGSERSPKYETVPKSIGSKKSSSKRSSKGRMSKRAVPEALPKSQKSSRAGKPPSRKSTKRGSQKSKKSEKNKKYESQRSLGSNRRSAQEQAACNQENSAEHEGQVSQHAEENSKRLDNSADARDLMSDKSGAQHKSEYSPENNYKLDYKAHKSPSDNKLLSKSKSSGKSLQKSSQVISERPDIPKVPSNAILEQRSTFQNDNKIEGNKVSEKQESVKVASQREEMKQGVPIALNEATPPSGSIQSWHGNKEQSEQRFNQLIKELSSESEKSAEKKKLLERMLSYAQTENTFTVPQELLDELEELGIDTMKAINAILDQYSHLFTSKRKHKKHKKHRKHI